MATGQRTAEAIANGQRLAEVTLRRREAARARRELALSRRPGRLEFQVRATSAGTTAAEAHLQTAGFLVALGDSWFDYPRHDVLKLLDDGSGYNIQSAAHRGDPVELMSYHSGQIDQFARCLENVLAQGAIPVAVLLSGGGNDIAGDEFGMLLNSAVSPIVGWNADVVSAVIDERIFTAYTNLVSTINGICTGTPQLRRTLPVLVHGYDYPVPDGRGFLGGWPFPGPWLQPGFREKDFDTLQVTTDMMRVVIDRFNAMLEALPTVDASFGNVHYLDLRGTLSSDLAGDYREWWANELHPTERGFEAVTAKFAAVLDALPRPSR